MTHAVGHSPDECGWSCKFHNLTNKIKTEFAERRNNSYIKKAEAYGYNSVDDFKKAVKEAQDKGRARAQEERRKNLTKGLEINSYLKAGGGKSRRPNSDILNALLGKPVTKTNKTRKRRKNKIYAPTAPERKKTITKWVVVGGVAYPTNPTYPTTSSKKSKSKSKTKTRRTSRKRTKKRQSPKRYPSRPVGYANFFQIKMTYKVKISFKSKSNQFSGYESVSTKTFRTKKEAQEEITRLKKKMGKSKNSNNTQSYSIQQTDLRINPKTKKKKSAFDFFNV